MSNGFLLRTVRSANGNVFDVFDHEFAALDVLIDMERKLGKAAVRRFALLRCDAESSLVAMDDALVELVESQTKKACLDPERDLSQTQK